MTFNFIDLISYTCATAFTPGPNNIVAFASVMTCGFKRSIPFLIGIGIGLIVTMLAAGVLTSWVLYTFPSAIIFLKWLGFFYLVWLAYKIVRSERHKEGKETKRYSFFSGFVLQVVNAKIILFTITALSAFVIPVTNNINIILGACLLTSIVACLGTLTWSIAGSFLKKYYLNYFKVVNVTMSAILLYFAFRMIS